MTTEVLGPSRVERSGRTLGWCPSRLVPPLLANHLAPCPHPALPAAVHRRQPTLPAHLRAQADAEGCLGGAHCRQPDCRGGPGGHAGAHPVKEEGPHAQCSRQSLRRRRQRASCAEVPPISIMSWQHELAALLYMRTIAAVHAESSKMMISSMHA